MNTLFPIFIKPDKLHILLVGGGNVGLEKLTALLGNSPKARISLVADRLLPELEKQIAGKNITLYRRKFQEEDLLEKDIVMLATDDAHLHVEIVAKARKRHILVNVADTPELCDFYLGSVVQKNDLKIGISTNGLSPTFSKRLRMFFESILPEDTQKLIENLHAYRAQLKGDFSAKVQALNKLTESFIEEKKS